MLAIEAEEINEVRMGGFGTLRSLVEVFVP